MIDERELIKSLQTALKQVEKDLKSEDIDLMNKFIEWIDNFPKIEFPTDGSVNYNPKEAESDNLCSN